MTMEPSIKIWGFLNPLPFVITFSTERNQKLSISDPPPPFCDYVIHGCSLIDIDYEPMIKLQKYIFSNFACRFLNPNYFFQFEFEFFQCFRSEKPPGTS